MKTSVIFLMEIKSYDNFMCLIPTSCIRAEENDWKLISFRLFLKMSHALSESKRCSYKFSLVYLLQFYNECQSHAFLIAGQNGCCNTYLMDAPSEVALEVSRVLTSRKEAGEFDNVKVKVNVLIFIVSMSLCKFNMPI